MCLPAHARLFDRRPVRAPFSCLKTRNGGSQGGGGGTAVLCNIGAGRRSGPDASEPGFDPGMRRRRCQGGGRASPLACNTGLGRRRTRCISSGFQGRYKVRRHQGGGGCRRRSSDPQGGGEGPDLGVLQAFSAPCSPRPPAWRCDGSSSGAGPDRPVRGSTGPTVR